MSIQNAINNAAAKMLQNYGYDVVEVISLEESTRSGGFCETCYSEWAVVEITYIDSKGDRNTYAWSGEFGELIRELDRNSE